MLIWGVERMAFYLDGVCIMFGFLLRVRSALAVLLSRDRTTRTRPITQAALCRDFPIVLCPGNCSSAKATASELRQMGFRAIDVATGPVSSCHDRACELFFSLKGGRTDYGASHAAHAGHARFGRVQAAQHAAWCEERPVLLLCHSQGAHTALELIHLLEAHFFEGHATSGRWVLGVVCIAAPLRGVCWLHALGIFPGRVR